MEGPDEVVDFLEVGADGEDLVDDVFDARDAFGTQGVFDDAIVGQRNALFVDLTETTLVDQLPDGFQVGVPVRHIRFDHAEHVDGGLVHADKGAGVKLAQAEQLQDLLGLGGHGVDTTDTDHGNDLVFRLVKVVAGGAGLALHADGAAFDRLVLLDVRFSFLERGCPGCTASYLVGRGFFGRLLGEFFVAALLFQYSFGATGWTVGLGLAGIEGTGGTRRHATPTRRTHPTSCLKKKNHTLYHNDAWGK